MTDNGQTCTIYAINEPKFQNKIMIIINSSVHHTFVVQYERKNENTRKAKNDDSKPITKDHTF